MASLPFFRMHGTGNRILVVDARGYDGPDPSVSTLKRLADETTGPGFDQLMWLLNATGDDVRAAYRVFNADGSEVGQCGNGLRCLAWALSPEEAAEFELDSPAGRVTARVRGDNFVSVSMGQPIFAPVDVPFIADEEALRYDLDVGVETLEASVLSMGNPHVVLDVETTESAPVELLGPVLEQHPRFPAGANVGFSSIQSRSAMDLRVFERGVGETLACGTGACAAVVSGIRRGLLDEEVRVRLPGGEVVVSWRGDDVWLSGQVTLLEEGTIDL